MKSYVIRKLKGVKHRLATQDVISVAQPESVEAPMKIETKKGSFLDEDATVRKYVRAMPDIKKFCVDIGASDGISMSNTYKLFSSKWSGLALECIPEKFTELSKNLQSTKASLSNSMVTPDNVLNILKAYNVPKDFGFLSLDIDGYDYFVLEKLFTEYKPYLICAEINEKIPPPLKFTVKYDKDYFWNTTHFYGQSISQLDELCRSNGYVLVHLQYNNAFYVRADKYKGKHYDVQTAYDEGYRNQPDREEKFPWNKNFDVLLDMPVSKQMAFLNENFSKYKGSYTLKRK